MKKIIHVENPPTEEIVSTRRSELVVVTFSGVKGETWKAHLTQNEYKAEVIRQRLVEVGVKESDLMELEGLAYDLGYDNGYDAALDNCQ